MKTQGIWRLQWQSMRVVLAAAVLTVAAACGGGGDNTGPDVQPVVTISAPGGAAAVTSGVALQLSVRVTNNRGAVVNSPSVVWSSANTSIATVSGSGLVTGALAGSTNITATAEGISGTFPITVSAGAPARLGVQRQPAGAEAGAAFTTQPIVTVLDVAGNVVTTATPAVTAAIATGGGLLIGATSSNATGGAATFTTLGVSGTIGARTLVFSAPGLSAITSDPFTLQAGAPARLAMRTQPSGAASGAVLSVQPVIEVRDASDNLVASANVAVTASIASGGGTVTGTTVNAVQGLATFTNLALSGVIGTRTMTFSSNALLPVTSAAVDLVAGAPTTLFVQTAPAGGGLNSVFATQPVVVLRDNGGNLATSANAPVTAAITAGGGVLTGATSNAVGGVALFNGFGITGAIGARTISVSSPGLSSAMFNVTPCDQTRFPAIAANALTGPLVGFFQRQAAVDTVQLRDTNGSCTAFSFVNTIINYTGGGTWLTATSVPGASRIALSANPGVLAVGTYNATVTVTTGNAGNAQIPVTFDVRPAVTLTYGGVNQKVLQLDPNGTVRIVPQVQMGGIDVPGAPLQFISRSPTIATIAADGTITGKIGGQAWMIATTSAEGGASDSIFVNVTRTTGPLLRADITRFVYTRNVDFSVTVYLDLRGQTAGAANLVFTWPNTGANPPNLLRLNNTVPGATGAPVIVSDPATGTTRISIVSATGLTGLINLGRFDFTPQNAGASQFVLRIDELIGLDQSSLLGNANALQYPVVIR